MQSAQTPTHYPEKGFTLLELLTVIAIIGLLAAVIIASFGRARMSAQDKARLTTVFQLQLALETYYTNFGRYPSGQNFSPWSNDNPASEPPRGANNCFDTPANVWYCNDANTCINGVEQSDSRTRYCDASPTCQRRYDAIYELERRGYIPAGFMKDVVNKEGTIGTTCTEGNPSTDTEGLLGSGPPCDLGIQYCANDSRNVCGDRYEWLPGGKQQTQRYVIGTNITTAGAAYDRFGNYQIYEGGQRGTYIPRCVSTNSDCIIQACN